MSRAINLHLDTQHSDELKAIQEDTKMNLDDTICRIIHFYYVSHNK